MRTAILPIILSLAVSVGVAKTGTQTGDTPQSSLRVVQQFIAALESKDLDVILPLLAENATLTYPMRPSGEPPPGTTYSGRQAVMAYLGQVVQNMAQIKFTEPRLTPSPDGKTVFFEAHGDFRTRTGTPYRNTYVTRFDIERGLLVRGTEYANPVTYAMAFGGKLGKDTPTEK